MNFGQRLLEIRDARGWTQLQLANKLGKAKSTISQWELGNRTPSLQGIQEVADILGVSTNYLTGEIDDMYTDATSNVIIEAMHSRPELKLLFDIALVSDRDNILMVSNILEKLVDK